MTGKRLSRRGFLKVMLGAGAGVAATRVLGACAPQPTAAPAGVAPTAGASADLEGSITCWGWDPCDKAFQSNVDSFKAKFPKANVNVVNVSWDDLHTKLAASIEAGMGAPDVCVVEGYMTPKFHGKGTLDLTERMAPYMDKIVPGKLGEVQSEGKIWGVPWDTPPALLLYRSDYFEEAGITEIPKTWDEFVNDVGPKVTKGGERYLFGMDPNTAITFYWYRPLLYQIGSGYFDKDGNVILGDDKSMKVLQWMYDAVNTKKVAMTGIEYFEGPSWFSALKDGKIASIFGAPWMIAMMKDQNPEASGKWKAAPLPVFEGDDPTTTVLGGASVIIPEQTKYPELAWKFVEHTLLTVEGGVSICKSAGIWPSYLPALQDKFFDEPDPYFGGQAVGRAFADVTAKVPVAYFGKNFPSAEREIVRPHIVKILNNEEKIDEGIKAAVDALKALGK